MSMQSSQKPSKHAWFKAIIDTHSFCEVCTSFYAVLLPELQTVFMGHLAPPSPRKGCAGPSERPSEGLEGATQSAPRASQRPRISQTEKR